MELEMAPREALRRLDWRFLLPQAPAGVYRHFALPGAGEALASRLRTLGLADQVSTATAGEREADAVAVLAGSGVSLAQAAQLLRPDGVLYFEVDRRRPGSRTLTPARLARALRRLGLTPLGFYAVRPALRAPELYLPLAAPAALRWYVNTLYQATTATQRLGESALRLVTGLDGQRLGPLAPFYAVIATAGAGARLPAVLETAQPLLGQTKPVPLLLADSGNRVTMLPFTETGRQPLLVLKVPKLPTFNGRTENEQQALHLLQSLLGPRLRATIPRPLGILPHGPISVSAESYCAGRSLQRASSRWGDTLAEKVADLAAATDWLIAFHRQLRHPAGSPWYREWLERPLSAYEHHFGLTPGERALFDAAQEYARRLHWLQLPTVETHRDFNVWNLYRQGNQLNVIDWEGARPGPPLCDLLHFSTYWYLAVTGRRSLEGHRQGVAELFFGDGLETPAGRAVHLALAHYNDALFIDARLQPVLFLYLWVELALRRRQQQVDGGRASADGRQDNQFVAHVEALSPHRDQLFGGTTGGTTAGSIGRSIGGSF